MFSFERRTASRQPGCREQFRYGSRPTPALGQLSAMSGWPRAAALGRFRSVRGRPRACFDRAPAPTLVSSPIRRRFPRTTLLGRDAPYRGWRNCRLTRVPPTEVRAFGLLQRLLGLWVSHPIPRNSAPASRGECRVSAPPRFPARHNPLPPRSVLDHQAGPDQIHQLGLRHDSLAAFGQRQKHVECPRSH